MDPADGPAGQRSRERPDPEPDGSGPIPNDMLTVSNERNPI